MSELLFESYEVPAVAYGVDALFSAYHHFTGKGLPLQDTLVVSSGHQATHIMPVLNGRLDARHCKRYVERVVCVDTVKPFNLAAKIFSIFNHTDNLATIKFSVLIFKLLLFTKLLASI